MTTRRPWGLLVILAVALSILAVVALPALEAVGAEKAVKLPDPLTKETIRELVSRLSDAEVRELLLAQLDKAAAPTDAKADGSMTADLVGNMDRARTGLGAVLSSWPALPAAFGEAVRQFSEGRGRYHLLLVGALVAVMLALAWAVERVVVWLLAGVRARLDRGPDEGAGGGAGSALIRAVLDLLLLAVFVVTSFAIFLALYQGHGPSRELVVKAILTIAVARLAILIARILLAPHAPAQRLLPFDDATARVLYRGVAGLVWLWVVLDLNAFFAERFGMAREPVLLVILLGRLVFVAALLRLVWRVRWPIAAKIRGDGHSTIRRVLADLWPALMTTYILGILAIVTIEQLGGRVRTGRAGILSLLVVIAMPMVDMALRRLLERGAAKMGASGSPDSGTSFVPVLRRAVHIVVTVAGVLVIVNLWNLDLMGLAARGVGARVTGALTDIGLTLLLAYLVWQFAKTAIDRRLEQEAGPRA